MIVEKTYVITAGTTFNTLGPRYNGRHFAEDIFKSIFLEENIWISIKISLKIVPKGAINKIPALVQIMAWRRPGDKPLSESMMVSLLTHTCVTRPQGVNIYDYHWRWFIIFHFKPISLQYNVHYLLNLQRFTVVNLPVLSPSTWVVYLYSVEILWYHIHGWVITPDVITNPCPCLS